MDKIFYINGEEIRVQEFGQKDGVVKFTLKGRNYSYSLVTRNGTELVLDKGIRFKASVGSPSKEGESVVMTLGREATVSSGAKKIRKGAGHIGGLTSPMPGKIFKILKGPGSEVKKGDAILILEAMKMEHSIRSDKDGIVKSIPYKVGELVQGGVLLAEVE
jgi:biotin carboxyl carrier protein